MQPPVSVNNVPIDIPRDRWELITQCHPEVGGYTFELQETVENPDAVFETSQGDKIAVREISKGLHLAVIYRENEDGRGIMVTSYITQNTTQFDEYKLAWKNNT